MYACIWYVLVAKRINIQYIHPLQPRDEVHTDLTCLMSCGWVNKGHSWSPCVSTQHRSMLAAADELSEPATCS